MWKAPDTFNSHPRAKASRKRSAHALEAGVAGARPSPGTVGLSHGTRTAMLLIT